MHWRRMGANPAEHVFGHAMPVTSDGALIAVRMANHTANAGRVYFAAGSFEPEDFPTEFADVDGNMEREVLEETGLDFRSVPREHGYHAHAGKVGTVIVRRFTSTRRQRRSQTESSGSSPPKPGPRSTAR